MKRTSSTSLLVAAVAMSFGILGCSPDKVEVVKTDTSNPAGVTMTAEQKQQTIDQIQNNPNLTPAMKERLTKQAKRFGPAGGSSSIPH